MTARILAIRPEPGLSQTIARAAEHGIQVHGAPLFEVRPVDWALPDKLDFDGILLGSANAIRHGGVDLANLLDMPVYAVGATTAQLAEEAGFAVAKVGQGGLQSLLDELDGGPKRLLRLAASDRIDLKPPPIVQIVERVVYESCALSMSDALQSVLTGDTIVMLHSARAAEHLASELSRIGLAKDTIRLAAMGMRIAAAAGEGWAEIAIADRPDDAALLALLENMCK